MDAHHRRAFGTIAIASLVLGVGVTALLGADGFFSRPPSPATSGAYPAGKGAWDHPMMRHYPLAPPACALPALPGTLVDVTLTDMAGMMGHPMPGGMMAGPGRNEQTPGQSTGPRSGMAMMRIISTPATVPAGQVSFRAYDAGRLNHELVVLPLAGGQIPGQRQIDPDGTVDEAGSLGEASRSCGTGAGDEASGGSGIAPGAVGGISINLAPGRYELICNMPGHYGAGMYAELDVV